MRKTGLLEWAASNDIIMLFPQNNDPRLVNLADHCWYSAAVGEITP